MSDAVWKQTLDWVAYYHQRNQGTQELNLAGIGESTLHPNFVRYVHEAREVVGPDSLLTFTTNGLLITEELAQALAPAKVAVGVSLHRPEKAGPAIAILRRYGLFWAASADPSLNPTNWAGQVNWIVAGHGRRPCVWVRGGAVFVMADGRVSRCCYDASGVGVFATIDDDLTQLATSPYVLCRTCEQDVGVPLPPP